MSTIFILLLNFHRQSSNCRSRMGQPGIEPDEMFETKQASGSSKD
jgi:hypothetical protein